MTEEWHIVFAVMDKVVIPGILLYFQLLLYLVLERRFVNARKEAAQLLLYMSDEGSLPRICEVVVWLEVDNWEEAAHHLIFFGSKVQHLVADRFQVVHQKLLILSELQTSLITLYDNYC